MIYWKKWPAAILYGLKLACGRFSGTDVVAQFWRRAKSVVFARVPSPLGAGSQEIVCDFLGCP